ncbi:uncharacterized protein LOC129708816 isoform X1 [Leucoraja erinacea]|uniref:uncharacterized protein LOC129708816 isoform X1 n=1 Tax=Leucoraja erinaceus TaxID=7782 RepID=UPI002454A5EE|nr:uncharacterized protein LOC129708816 isoform X1 [Leucoraja erinacea]
MRELVLLYLRGWNFWRQLLVGTRAARRVPPGCPLTSPWRVEQPRVGTDSTADECLIRLLSLPVFHLSNIKTWFPGDRWQFIPVTISEPENSNGCHEDEIDVNFLMTSTPKLSKTANQEFIDPILLKPQRMHIVEKENTEHISQLYTKLFQEAEKIKRWKLSMDNELWQKDKKLQENKQTIEVQRKAIQEQQVSAKHYK